MYLEKPTQEQRILKILEDAKGEWVNGRYFIQTMMISQAHARVHSLEKKRINIEHSDFVDEFGFRSYRIPVELKQHGLPL